MDAHKPATRGAREATRISKDDADGIAAAREAEEDRICKDVILKGQIESELLGLLDIAADTHKMAKQTKHLMIGMLSMHGIFTAEDFVSATNWGLNVFGLSPQPIPITWFQKPTTHCPSAADREPY